MYYFKKIELHDPNSAIVENAIRAFSLKRHTALDFKAVMPYKKEEKYFLANENKGYLKVTRLRTPFERFLPDIIIRFEKNKGFSSFQIRFTFITTIVLCALVAGLISNLWADYFAFENVLVLCLLLFLFAVLTLMEIAITRTRINKAIQKTTENEFLRI